MLRERWGGIWVAGWEGGLKRMGEERSIGGESYWWSGW